MRVFFLINKFLNNKNFGKTSDILSLNSSLKKKNLIRLRKKNFKIFSSVLVYSGNLKKNKNSIFLNYKKVNTSLLKIKKFSKLKFLNIVNKLNLRKAHLNIKANYLNKQAGLSYFLNRKKSNSYFYTKYYKVVLPIRFNFSTSLVFSNNFDNKHFLPKNQFYFLNNYSYTMQQNELNFLYNNNFYENESNDFFYNKLNLKNLKNIFLDLNFSHSSKEGSYMKQLEEKSFFFNSLYMRRLFFEKNDLNIFISKNIKSNFLYFFKKDVNFFNFKSSLTSFNYDSDFVYKYLKSKGKRFYLSYYNKLNHFFLNLKKNDLLFKKVSKKLFLKKYNMLKLYINDFIDIKLNKNLFMGFMFKNPIFFDNKLNNNLFFLNQLSLINNKIQNFNYFYADKKEIFNLNYLTHTNSFFKSKNYLSFSFNKQVSFIMSFFNFFISSMSEIKHISNFHKLFFDLYSVYNYLRIFLLKQKTELLSLNFNFFNLNMKENLLNTGLISENFSKIYKNYLPFLYEFSYKSGLPSFLKNYNNFYYFLKDFTLLNSSVASVFFINNIFLKKNYYFVVEDLFFTNYKYYYLYIRFFSNLNFFFKKLFKKNKSVYLYNYIWISIIYLK